MPATCTGCRDGEALAFDFSMAFQPIIELRDGSIFAHEALVRGTAGESASSILSQVTQKNLYAFDHQAGYGAGARHRQPPRATDYRSAYARYGAGYVGRGGLRRG